MIPLSHCCAQIAFAVAAISALAQVTTSQYDNQRTGATLHEKTLTAQNVNARQFGKLGRIQSRRRRLRAALVPSRSRSSPARHARLLLVATEHDSVYGFDANRPGDPPLWQVSLLDKARGSVPVSEDDAQCPFIRPEVGITSTPVIDLQTGTLYVLARTKIRHAASDDEYFQHLHALAITTGVEKFGGPKLISASVPGKGAGTANGQVAFDPLKENPRAALAACKQCGLSHLGFVLRRGSIPRLGHGLRSANAGAKGGSERQSRRQRSRHLG